MVNGIMQVINRFSNILIVIGFLLIIIIIFGQTLIPPTGQMLFGDDVFRSYGFFREFFVQSLKSGTVPWWNPYLFSGTPFLANPSVSFLYPLNWLFIFLPINSAFAIIFAVDILIALTGSYWLGRRVMSVSRLAAFAGSLVFGLSGFFFARIWGGHAETLAAAAWVPWVYGAYTLSFLEINPKRIIFAGIIFAVQILSGYQTIALFTLEAVGITALLISLKNRSFRPFVSLIISLVFGMGLSFVQLLPNLEFFRHSVRILTLPYSWASTGAINWQSLRQMVTPFFQGDQVSFVGLPPNYWEQAAFSSVTAVILVLIVLVYLLIKSPKFLKGFKLLNNKSIFILCFIFMVLFSVWMALGPNAPFDIFKFFWQYVPLYRNIRIPARHLMLLDFALSGLVMIAVNRFKPKPIQVLLIILIAFELINFDRHFITFTPTIGSMHDISLIKRLTTESKPIRLLQNFGCWISPRDALDFDAVMPYRIFSATGYDPSMLAGYFNFADAVNNSKSSSISDFNVQIPYLNVYSEAFDFLNIKYLMVPTQYDSVGGANAKFTVVKTDLEKGYRLYENKTVMPRFFMVKNIEVFVADSEIATLIGQGKNLKENLLVRQNQIAKVPVLSNCGKADKPVVQLISYNTNAITLNTESPCDAYLSTSEVAYPGWRAEIDGVETKIITSNLAFRSIPVPRGKHTIIMRYVPQIFMIGAFVSLMTAIICAVWFVRSRKV
jgi:hypothetical protein